MKSAGRYEIRNKLGEGGMGIVYRAVDPAMNNREVTVKTIKDPQDRGVLELFKRECSVLASLTHPNIVEIFDIGEVEEDGVRLPYFVMPYLKGVTLQELIKTSSPRLTVERSVYMISQVCRGLQVAHEHQLVHRDLKPSNLFVLPDDSVKIIDFGVAHLANHMTLTGLKGTPLYMAPEQVQRKQPSALSDQFSIAVVCYEMLARRHPFSVAGHEDLADAILHYKPPPVSDFNPLVNAAISQVIHKALAKLPHYRFSSVREFSDHLERALRNEQIEIFDPARMGPRLVRARTAFEVGDLDDAAEIIIELEAENYLAPEIAQLQIQIEEAKRAKTVKQLLDTAQRRFNEEEYVRALQKVQEILDIDPTNTQAFTLKGAIENKRSATQIEEWLRLAGQHLENRSYSHARQALGKVLDFQPRDVRAQALLAEVERREQEHIKLRTEKQQAYQSALNAYQRGEINSALNKLERLLDLDRRAPDTTSPEMGTAYQKLYEEVRSKREHLSYQEAEARRLLTESNFAGAKSICDEVLSAYANNVLFRFLRDDVEQAERLEISAFVARVEKEVASEPDLTRKASILTEARDRFPSEARLEQALLQVESRRDRVDAIAARARALEETSQFSEAIEQWQTLRSIYPQYPGLDIDINRLRKRREQQAREEVKAQWANQIDQALALRNYTKAADLIADAVREFPGDAELSALSKHLNQLQARAVEAEQKAQHGKQLYGSGYTKEGLELLREAYRLDAHSTPIRIKLLEGLLGEATRQIDVDWRGAEPFIREAFEIEPSNPLAKSLSTLIQDKKQAEDVSSVLSNARELQQQGSIRDAIRVLDEAGARYPQEKRLTQLRAVILESLSAQEQADLRVNDLREVTELVKESEKANDIDALESIFKKTQAYTRYKNDADFRGPLSEIEERLREKKGPAGQPAGMPVQSDAGAVSTAESPQKTLELRKVADTIRNWVSQCWEAVSHSTRLKAALVSIGSTLAVLLLIALVRYVSAGKFGQKPVELSSSLTSVTVKNLPGNDYMVMDQSGSDVTNRLATGLKAGRYRLVAHRSGFEQVDLRFTIDPSTEHQKNFDVEWKALPTELMVKVAHGLGVLNVDGADQTLDGNDQFRTRWRNGSHAITWGLKGRKPIKIDFDIRDLDISPRISESKDAAGMVTVFTQSEVSFQIFDISGVEKLVSGQSEPVSATDKFRYTGTEPISFRTRDSAEGLVELKPAPNGQPVISVYLATKKRGAGSIKQKQEPTRTEHADRKDNTGAQPPAQSDEELRKKEKEEKRRKLLDELKGEEPVQPQ